LGFQPMPNDAMTDEGEGAQAEGDVEHSAVTRQVCTPKVCFQNKNAASQCRQADLKRCQLVRDIL
jgi:hypothetical protein